MRIIWSPQALSDLLNLRIYIAERDPAAAIRMANTIIEKIETLLPVYPELGRNGRVRGTRELVIASTPYLVPYRIKHETIEILRIYHSSRRWPKEFL